MLVDVWQDFCCVKLVSWGDSCQATPLLCKVGTSSSSSCSTTVFLQVEFLYVLKSNLGRTRCRCQVYDRKAVRIESKQDIFMGGQGTACTHTLIAKVAYNPTSDNSWEPRENIHAEKLIKEFQSRVQKPNKHKGRRRIKG